MACSTVTGAAFALSGQQATQAAITYIDPVDIPIPQTFAGIYFNLENGAFAVTPAGAPGWDVNPYSNPNLTFYGSAATGSAIAFTGTTVDSVPAGTDLATLAYDPAAYNLAASAPILAGGTHFIAMTFVDGAAATNRAWVEVTTTAGNGFPSSITRWAFAPVAEPLAAGQVPEPGSAALGLLAAGALGLRRRRAA